MKGVCEVCGGSTWSRSARRCKTCYVTALRQRTGAANREWNNFSSTKKAQGWDRAKRRFPLGQCVRCSRPAIDRHHINNNPLDNRPENILVLCRRCHMELDGRMVRFSALNRNV